MVDKHLRVWFVVFVIAVFLAGMGGGMILDRLVGPPRPGARPVAAGGPAQGPGRGMGAGVAMQRLAVDLALTAEQRPKLDAILAESRTRIQQVQGEVQGKFEAEQQWMRDEIRKILTPEQQKRFDEWIARGPMPGLMRGGRGMAPGMGPGRGRGMGPGRGRGPGGRE